MRIFRNVLVVVLVLLAIDLVILNNQIFLNVLFGGTRLVSPTINSEQKRLVWTLDSWSTIVFGQAILELVIDGDNTKEDSELGQYDFSLSVSVAENQNGLVVPVKTFYIRTKDRTIESNRDRDTTSLTGTEFRYYLGTFPTSFFRDQVIDISIETTDGAFLTKRPHVVAYPAFNDVFYGLFFAWGFKFIVFLVGSLVLLILVLKLRSARRRTS